MKLKYRSKTMLQQAYPRE